MFLFVGQLQWWSRKHRTGYHKTGRQSIARSGTIWPEKHRTGGVEKQWENEDVGPCIPGRDGQCNWSGKGSFRKRKKQTKR